MCSFNERVYLEGNVMDEIQLIEKLLPQMAEVMNILPGEEFRMKDSDTLLILQSSME